MNRVDAFLELLIKQQGSDLHLISGNSPKIRLYGDIFPVKYRELSVDETTAFVYEIMPEWLKNSFQLNSNIDFAYEVPDLARFRVNVFRHLNGIGAVFRAISTNVPTLEELDFPSVFYNLSNYRKGLILVTGPTGSGKSTTQAAMVDYINKKRKGHIITIEDPIEFVHNNKGCLVSQREVGHHARGFAEALRSALREDPDVVLVGEMRDLETIHLALTAAEIGILVLGTLHTNGASAAIDRIVNVFPAGEEPYIRTMLSTSLCGVVSQQLVRKAEGNGRIAALEILINNSASANMIREGRVDQLENVIQNGRLLGMQTLDHALRSLMDAKLISGNNAYLKAKNKKDFENYREFDDAV